MKNRMKNALRAVCGNEGSGLILVLITMMCLTIFGATVMSMSFIGYRMRVNERSSEKEFYDASSAMDEIRAGIQVAVSDAIAEAYEDAMINYNDASYQGSFDTMEKKFQSVFREELKEWTNTAGTRLFTSDTQFSPEVIRNFVTATAGADVEASGTWNYDPAIDEIRMQDVRVTYTSPKTGYVTRIATDIMIGMPKFEYVMSSYSAASLPEYAVIAKDGLKQEVFRSILTIDGSAYAGEISLNGKGSALTITGGEMVCAQDVTVEAEGPVDLERFNVTSDARLWANRITVGLDSSIDLAGTTYLADDLELSGQRAKAILSKYFYGFGNSETDPAKSSAILVNGRDTEIDMSGLNMLMLAGHSFISDAYIKTPGIEAGSSVLMGESLSVRQNQQAYLVPSEYLVGVGGNPASIGADEEVLIELTEAGQQKVNRYDATIRTISTVVPGFTGQKIVYFFMTFDDTVTDGTVTKSGAEKANDFFKTYFEENPAQIRGYLDTYTDLQSNSSLRTQTAGYTIVQDNAGGYRLKDYVPASNMTTSVAQMENNFDQLKKTLFIRDNAAPDSMTPYDYFVKTDMVNALGTEPKQFRDAAGDVVGLVYNNAGTPTSTRNIKNTYGDKVCLVIASGNVTVEDSAFDGLVISGGIVELRADMNALEENVSAAFFAAADDGELLADYLLDGVAESTVAGTGGESSWDLHDIVTYDNWKKN